MKRDIAKIVGYPAFILLGAMMIDQSMDYLPLLGFPLTLVYALGIFLCASDPAVYRLPFKYRLLGVVTLAMAAWWCQSWPLYLGFMLAAGYMGLLDPERRRRDKRIWAWIRSVSHRT